MSILESEVAFMEILPRLPLKSLFRFKCVSKFLNSAISSPEFVQLYLRHQLLRPDSSDLLVLPGHCLIHCYDLDSPPLFPATATFAWDHTPLVPATATFSWEDHLIGEFYIVGSCNGLLCVLKKPHLILLNPSTRMCQSIRILRNRAIPTDFGFAFDHENLDYKIVVVFNQYGNWTRTRVTRVYSLNTNSWNDVGATPPSENMDGCGGVLINDHLLHWKLWNPSLRKHKICCFDVCTQNWKNDVLFPAYYYDPNYDNKIFLLDFGVVDGCLFWSVKNLIDSCFDVWVMKEYGVQDSWTKLLSIPVDQLNQAVVPIVCRQGSGDILIRRKFTSSLFWYNTVNKEMTEAVFHRAPKFLAHRPYTCIRSLVCLPRGVLFEDLQEPPDEDEDEGGIV